MDFGVYIASLADSWRVVQRAEQLGYSRAWFFDSQMFATDLFVSMTAAALNTSRIRLASGVMVPSNRIAPVAASGLASLNALAPGRIDFGISTGSTARSSMGLPRVKLADMEEYIRVVRALLAGETLEWEFEGKRRKIRFLDPDIGALNIKDPIPLYISAFGPRARQLVARLGAGLIDVPGSVERAKTNLADIRNAYAESGRDPATLHYTVTLAGCVLKEGESADSPRVKAIAGPDAMILMHKLGEQATGTLAANIPEKFAPLIERYRAIWRSYQPEDARYLTNHRGHGMYLRPEEVEVCTGEWIRATTFTATKGELRERIQELKRLGVNHVAMEAGYRHPEVLEDWMAVFESV